MIRQMGGNFSFSSKVQIGRYREVIHSVAPGHQQRQTQEFSERKDF